MTKSEIIQAVTNAAIPEGTTLVERELPIGITVSRIVSPKGASGMNFTTAPLLAGLLRDATADLPDRAGADLFQRIHITVNVICQGMATVSTQDFFEKAVIRSRSKILEKLRALAVEFGIQYQEPEDNP